MEFYRWIAEAARRNDSLLCVGLDPRPERLAPGDDLYSFNRRIVDATRDLVCAYKPNFAFYESAGPEGLEALRRTVAYVHQSGGRAGNPGCQAGRYRLHGTGIRARGI